MYVLHNNREMLIVQIYLYAGFLLNFLRMTPKIFQGPNLVVLQHNIYFTTKDCQGNSSFNILLYWLTWFVYAMQAHSAYNGIGIVKLMGRHSGFIAMHASLASGQIDVCLIPEVCF
jgi:hypothetical protein